MTLVVDRRDQLDGAGLHAIVAGVSHYRHLPGGGGAPASDAMGMSQLTSAALSAFRIAQWLERRADRLTAPLATLRLLLSPSEREVEDVEPTLATVAEPCIFETLRSEISDWRADASGRSDDITLFYFAGHGVQRVKGDAVMLCEDFGDGVGDVLDRAINGVNLYNGMAPAPGREDIARTQFYFVDACRIRPDAFSQYEPLTPGALWSVPLAGRDNRCAPIFYAAVPGSLAYARPAEQTLFSTALLAGLDGEAGEAEDDDGEARWSVSYQTLVRTLADRLHEETRTSDAEQEFRMDGSGADVVIHHLDGPPPVKLLVEIAPPEALDCTHVEICDNTGAPCQLVPMPLRPHPYTCELPAGMYTISARIAPKDPRFRDRAGTPWPVRPPSYRWVRSVAA